MSWTPVFAGTQVSATLARPKELPDTVQDPDALLGRTIGPYHLQSIIGAGGMGTVYKAQDTRLGRTVAIKVLPPEVASDPDARERFEGEARAIAALNHPHICTLFDVGDAAGLRFLVMEYVEGGTLNALGALPLPADRIADIAAQVCDALDAAHAKGIVHRDLKPLNIMVTPRGHVKVLDFGVAKLLDPIDGTDATTARAHSRTGQMIGTPAYMSPEQACGDPVGPPSDVFALGIVLYQLATGRHPFAVNDDMPSLVRALLVAAPTPPRRLNAAVPEALDAAILRMLDKNPALRPSTAELQRLLHEPARDHAERGVEVKRAKRRNTVGRQRERALLDQAFDEADAGRPVMIAIAGEPGIGKTTIVEEFLDDLRTQGRAAVARGRCSERLAGSEAYLPVLEVLESLLADEERPAELMAALAPTWYAQIAPAGRGVATGVGAQLELRNASQERMKRELLALFEGVTGRRTLVLFFDDVHWADTSTVDLLGYLCSHFRSIHLLIVVTYRPTDLQLAKHPFIELRLDLTTRGLCREVKLGFLSRDETALYLDLEFAGHRFPAELAGVIHEKTEGNPLFIVDLARDLRDRRVIVPTEGGWTLAQSLPALERELPESVRSMIERKISQLVEDDRRLLVVASVQGYVFDSAVVAKALGRDAAEVEDRLEALENVHAFTHVLGEETLPNGTPTLRCRFVHVLYQNALYNSLRATRRASLSSEVAHAIVAFHGENNQFVASELAVLFETARDPARAARYFTIAAENALAVFAFVEAAAIAERGIRLLMSTPESAERNSRELKLQIALGTAAVAIRGYASPEVERAYGRARELCRQTGDPAELASVIFGLFVYYVVVPSYSTSLELGDETLAIAARERSDALRVQGLLIHGMTRFWLGDVEPCGAALTEGIALYDEQRSAMFARTPLFDHGVGCRRYHAASLWLQGYPDQGLRRAQEALADVRSMNHPLTVASTLAFVSMLHHFRRDADAARVSAAEAVACTREYVLTYWLGFARALHGWAIAQLASSSGSEADWDRGVSEIRESLEAHRSAGARTFRVMGQALLADTYLLRERFDEADQAAAEGLAVAAETDERVWEAELHRLRGELARAQGFAEEARTHFERAIGVAGAKHEKSLELRALMSFCRLVDSGDDPALRKRVREDLARTYGWFTEGFATVDLREAKSLLG
jgi:predicted ATPase